MPLWQVLTLVCLTSCAAACVGSFLARGSAYSLLKRRVRELETEVASLTSEYSKVLGLAKKISQRVALDDHRHKRSGIARSDGAGPPPPGDKKAAKAYYLHGKSHQQIAREAMNGVEQ